MSTDGKVVAKSGVCNSPLATRALLYSDTLGGEQVCRDDMWAVTTAELNALHPAPAPAAGVEGELVERCIAAMKASLALWEADARLWPAADKTLKPLIAELEGAALERTGAKGGEPVAWYVKDYGITWREGCQPPIPFPSVHKPTPANPEPPRVTMRLYDHPAAHPLAQPEVWHESPDLPEQEIEVLIYAPKFFVDSSSGMGVGWREDGIEGGWYCDSDELGARSIPAEYVKQWHTLPTQPAEKG